MCRQPAHSIPLMRPSTQEFPTSHGISCSGLASRTFCQLNLEITPNIAPVSLMTAHDYDRFSYNFDLIKARRSILFCRIFIFHSCRNSDRTDCIAANARGHMVWHTFITIGQAIRGLWQQFDLLLCKTTKLTMFGDTFICASRHPIYVQCNCTRSFRSNVSDGAPR